jgi:hypothetical protein
MSERGLIAVVRTAAMAIGEDENSGIDRQFKEGIFLLSR